MGVGTARVPVIVPHGCDGVSLLLSGTQAGAQPAEPLPAPTVSLLDTLSADATALTCVSGTITPSDNALLVVVVRRQSGGTPTMTTSLSNVGSWTVSSVVTASAGTMFLAYARVTGDPGSGTVTATYGSTRAGRLMLTHEVLGSGTPGTPVIGTASTTGTTFSVDVGTPAANALVFAAVTSEGNSAITPAAPWNELGEAAPATTRRAQSQWAEGVDVSDGVADWTGMVDTTARNGIVVEIPAG